MRPSDGLVDDDPLDRGPEVLPREQLADEVHVQSGDRLAGKVEACPGADEGDLRALPRCNQRVAVECNGVPDDARALRRSA